MQWTRQRQAGNCAADEWRFLRTAKSCGPDAPTLASSWRNYSANDGGNKARSGENTKETVVDSG